MWRQEGWAPRDRLSGAVPAGALGKGLGAREGQEPPPSERVSAGPTWNTSMPFGSINYQIISKKFWRPWFGLSLPGGCSSVTTGVLPGGAALGSQSKS